MNAILKTALFTIVVPATVAGWVPWRLRGDLSLTPDLLLRCLGFLFIAAGCAIYLHTAFWGFALHGRGTPAPIAPPKKLVVEGLHRYVRNPMYIGVLLIVFGQAVLFWWPPLAGYGVAVWLAFYLFVLFYEEPALQKQFGDEYEAYRRRVPRWIPRF
jgi:protein-S-isoprenylcysteine O-methyltransferase Ste14